MLDQDPCAVIIETSIPVADILQSPSRRHSGRRAICIQMPMTLSILSFNFTQDNTMSQINRTPIYSEKWFDIMNPRIKICWKSPIFFPLLLIDDGLLSRIGPLEEKSPPLVLTIALQSKKNHLIHGPLRSKFYHDLSWHPMNHAIDRCFHRNSGSREEEGTRATAFFLNAFTRDLEGLENFNGINLLPDRY